MEVIRNKDQHVNTSISKDNNSCMEAYIRNAFTRKVDEITVVDEFNPLDKETLNVEDYYYEYIRFIRNELTTINLGIEVVMSDSSEKSIKDTLSLYKFDLVVGSVDLSKINVVSKDIYKEYLETVLVNIMKYKDHIDVISSRIDLIGKLVKNFNIDIASYQEIIDKILIALIENNIGIEINSSNFGVRDFYNIPSVQILKRYKELGGNIITVGSYASSVGDLSLYFENVYKVLESIGFQTISQFHRHIPEPIELRRLRTI